MPAVASRGSRRRTISEINMVPFIDVMLVLLIIFMVAAPMITTGVVDLPTVGKAKQRPQSVIEIVVGTGTAVAIAASDITLVTGDLRAAADAIRLSRRTLGTIKTNLFWAFAYNVAAIPLAAAGLLNPLVAGAAMAFSSVFVVTNSLRLRRFKADRREHR